MTSVATTPPLYDRRRLETLVNAHKLRAHLEQKKAKKPHNAGVKALR